MSEKRPEVGSLAEEAAKLVGALSGWAEGPLSDPEGARDFAATLGHQLSDHVGNGPDCVYCPVCRLLAMRRHASPEVRAHLAAAAGSLMQAAAAFLATEPGQPPARDHVERIPVDEGTNGDEASTP